MTGQLKYVLITPARNEAQHIELTLRSMVAQTLRPIRWVIVSDGSTDGTDEIVGRYTAVHPWVELLRMPERRERHFAGKVQAFNAGYERVQNLDFDIVGNLDGDTSFEADHFEYLIARMNESSDLGVTGAPFRELGLQYDYRFSNIENVWGGCQLFRRRCFEEIGGYRPLKGGCIDHVAVLSARQCGWKTRTFPQRVCIHHRPMGTALHGSITAKFRLGAKDYSVGNHPLWQIARSIYQTTRPPYLLGGIALASGYVWSAMRRAERAIPAELIAFVRQEQMQRLSRLVTRSKYPGSSPAGNTL